jgi:type IV pilus assembly protein PilW
MKVLKNKSRELPVQTGFSIIELMISIPIGLLVLAAVLKIFTASMEGVHLQNGFSRVQENGRIATELMVRDIRGADYWGCAGGIANITSHLDTTDTDYDASLYPPINSGVAGGNDVATFTIDGVNVVGGTDTLTLRGSNSLSDINLTATMPGTAAVIKINTGSSLALGDIVLISDCRQADLFSNTITNTPGSGNLGHAEGNIALAGAVNNSEKNFENPYAPGAQILTPFTKQYFIGVNTAGTNSLYRADNGDANELVRGINNLQIMYGEDTSGNGSVNTFTATPTDMDEVLSIRVSLTAESGPSSSGTPLQRTYQTTANIRNRTL